jgi:SP family galactose:H+ symporter-like MFS transporter
MNKDSSEVFREDAALEKEVGQKIRKNKLIVYVVGVVAALAGLLFGLDIGVISGVLPWLDKEWGNTPGIDEFIVSSLLVGAFVGTLLSGYVSRKFGRKKAILVSAVIFGIGAMLSAISVNAYMMEAVRFFLGIAVGIASFTAPLYLSEMAPQRIRGAMISMYQLMITIGIVLAFMSDTLFSSGGHWRYMLGILVLPSAVMFIGILFLPESPRWLLLFARKDEARKVLKRLRNDEEEVDEEIKDIEEALEQKQNGFKLLKNKNFPKAIFLGIVLQAMQQFTGMNVVMYYAPKIFKDAGFASDTQQMWGTVLVGLINVLATFIAIAFVDKFGRKPILYIGYAVMGSAMWVLGTMFFIGILSAPSIQYVAIGALLIFIVGFAMSAGPIIWVICSEIYPLAGRDLGITVSTATNWACNAVVGATFLTLLNSVGDDVTFWLYGSLNLIFIVIIFIFSPETKGVSLEQIEKNLLAGKKLRRIGR